MRVSYNIVTLAIAATANAATHDVAVGQFGLKYTPNTTYAAVGDTIIFSFYPMNHNVVSGPYDTPCRDGDGSGMYSGFIPSSEGIANRTFQITINNTDPIWFYCSKKGGGGHCTKGMVGVINPPSNTNQTLTQYAAGASNVKNTSYTEPGQVQLGAVIATSAYTNGTTTGGNGSNGTTGGAGASGNGSYTSPSVTFGGPVATGGSGSATSTGPATVATNAAAGVRAVGALVAAGGLAVALL
ncbi:uncharacterized protein PAC_06302 [Phialocephala subalpina]|uniref:Phytocyanin domain-containing protein n=1 Tax=Phialocephala subalpina TaxID=576137 RepID=A0A1L7WUF8_9HELO|nr:uncharacterized protein PAC_06302 [Phialocephala subalpina]